MEKQITPLAKLIAMLKPKSEAHVMIYVSDLIRDIESLLPEERASMEKMYVNGRKDSHLDYYPDKHARETFDETFTQTP
jgi:hypothetical protein